MGKRPRNQEDPQELQKALCCVQAVFEKRKSLTPDCSSFLSTSQCGGTAITTSPKHVLSDERCVCRTSGERCTDSEQLMSLIFSVKHRLAVILQVFKGSSADREQLRSSGNNQHVSSSIFQNKGHGRSLVFAVG